MKTCGGWRFDCVHGEVGRKINFRTRLFQIAIRKILVGFKFCNVFVNAHVSVLETTFYE